VDAAADGGLLADHRERVYCPLLPDLRLEELPIDPLPLRSLPAVLLGRLPAAPRRGEHQDPGASALSFRDAEGRRWTGELRSGAPVAWTLWVEGEPAVWWRRSDAEAVLSDRRRGLQMSWREVGREGLAQPLPDPAPPEGYAAGTCRSLSTISEGKGVPFAPSYLTPAPGAF
jgi:hypothetical protein